MSRMRIRFSSIHSSGTNFGASTIAMENFETLDTILFQLPDISLPEFDFLDSSFFRRQSGADTCRKLPSPQAVLEAAGKPWGDKGVWRFQELGVLVKFGDPSKLRLEEALTLRAINRMLPANQVPAPEVFGWKSTDSPGRRSNFIYMSLLPGQTLRGEWGTLSHEDKTSVSHQLAAVVKCLRSVKQGPGDQAICSLSRGPVQDLYFSPQFHKGPFASAREFHDFVQFIWGPWMPLEERGLDPYRPLLPDTAPILLTHGDLNLCNILVVRLPEGDRLTVSGIVDWEQAGWYPDYWEYCKAMIVGPYGGGWMESGWLDIVFQPSERDVEASEAFQFYWAARCP